MYHHVSDYPEEIIPSCLHTISQFKNTIIRLKNEVFTFISIYDAYNLIYEKEYQNQTKDIIKIADKKKLAIITFDDIFNTVYYNAYPILKDFNIPFAIFITTSYLDKEKYITTNQLKEMDLHPLCTVGAHTVNHPMLRKSSNIYNELKTSKDLLTKLLGHDIDFLAYPYGRQSSVSHKVMKIAKRVGYKCAFGTIHSQITNLSSKSRYFLPRMVLFS
jgi:peptidoglycan/xylan/chitin deacetylase (PgdA/CDA1 family)